MITVSAAVKLIPKPPALVHNKNTKRSESGLQNLSIAACLKLPRIRPSNLSNGYLENDETKSINLDQFNFRYLLNYLNSQANIDTFSFVFIII